MASSFPAAGRGVARRNAAQALEWLTFHGNDCDIVISDHGMPDLTGAELLSAVRAQCPHIRRMLLSGWGTNLPGGMDSSAAELILAKPVQQRALATALSKLMAHKAAVAG